MGPWTATWRNRFVIHNDNNITECKISTVFTQCLFIVFNYSSQYVTTMIMYCVHPLSYKYLVQSQPNLLTEIGLSRRKNGSKSLSKGFEVCYGLS